MQTLVQNDTRTHEHTYLPSVSWSPLLASCIAMTSITMPSSKKIPISKKSSKIDFVKYKRSFTKNSVDPLTPEYVWNKYLKCGFVVNAL